MIRCAVIVWGQQLPPAGLALAGLLRVSLAHKESEPYSNLHIEIQTEIIQVYMQSTVEVQLETPELDLKQCHTSSIFNVVFWIAAKSVILRSSMNSSKSAVVNGSRIKISIALEETK